MYYAPQPPPEEKKDDKGCLYTWFVLAGPLTSGLCIDLRKQYRDAVLLLALR
jgi:hypothetical protein